MFPVSATQIFKTASVVKSPFCKVTGEIAAFYSSVENSVTCICMFRTVALLVILRNLGFLLTSCDAIKNESLMLLKVF